MSHTSQEKVDLVNRTKKVIEQLEPVLKDSRSADKPILKTVLNKMRRTSADFHIFRRFREAILQMSEARTLLIDYWMGHANGEMSGRYGKQLLDNIR